MSPYLNGHDWLVQVVMHRELEALASLEVIGVVEGFRVEQNAQTVGFSNLASRPETNLLTLVSLFTILMT